MFTGVPSPFPPLVSPSFFFLREFFFPALLSERLEQASVKEVCRLGVICKVSNTKILLLNRTLNCVLRVTYLAHNQLTFFECIVTFQLGNFVYVPPVAVCRTITPIERRN